MTLRTLLLSIHIVAIGGWLGADMLQYVLAPRFERGGHESALAWARQTLFLHERYYAVVAAVVLVTGIGLVQEGGWDWSGGFIWVGIGAIVGGATLGGGGLGSLAKKRVAALEAGDGTAAGAIRRRMFPIELVVTLLPVLAVLAMVDKWQA